MLRRNSCRNLQPRPLSRSKSANSIVRNPVHELVSIEPVEAERDAHIAATISYYRSQIQNRSSEASAMPRESRSAVLSSSDSVSRVDDFLHAPNPISSHTSTAGNLGLRRQQSVRFAGPNAQPRRSLATRASINSARAVQANSTVEDFHRSINSSVTTISAYNHKHGIRPPSHSCAEPHYFQYMQYAPEDDIASLPSSYRKLRKSSSMYNSSVAKPPGSFINGSTSIDMVREWQASPQRAPLAGEEPSRGLSVRTLRAPKSMSFLRNHRERPPSRLSNATNHEFNLAVANGKSGEHSEPPIQLNSHSSMLFRSRHKRTSSSTSFPKSMRNSSNNSATLSCAISSDGFTLSKQPKLRMRARNISQSLRNKIKGLFSRPKSCDMSFEQPQGQAQYQESDVESSYHLQEQTHSPQEASMFQVLSHVPSFHAVPSCQQLKSRQGSVENVTAEEAPATDEKSRVTSWTSSAPDTLVRPDLERCQSYIPEPTRPKNTGFIDSDPAVVQNSQSSERAVPHPGPICNSQRVYSALMKRLEESRQHHGHLKLQDQSRSLGSRGVTPALNSSISSHRGHLQSREGSSNTIRCVRDDDDVFQDAKENNSPVRAPLESTANDSHPPLGSDEILSNMMAPHKMPTRNSQGSPGNETPTCVAAANEPPKPISSRSSAFFASPTCHLFRTTSPYRRALQESMVTSAEGPRTPDSQYLNSLSALSLPTRRPSTAGSNANLGRSYAESIYSCTSEEKVYANNTPEPNKNSQVNQPTDRYGDATIYVNSATHKSSASGNHRREVSSASSVEWKTWLSANVSKLETPSTAAKTDFSGDSSLLPPVRHIREAAEIEPDADESQTAYRPNISSPVPPLRLMPTVQKTSPTVSKSNVSSFMRRPSPAGNENSPPAAGVRSRGSCGKGTPVPLSKDSFSTVPSLLNINNNALSEPPKPRNSAASPPMQSSNAFGKPSPFAREEIITKRKSRNRMKFRHGGSAQSSPGLSTAFERQFGVTKTGSPGNWKTKFEESQVDSTPRLEAEGVDHLGRRDLDPQVMGSKRMVDLFLSSRRRRIDGSNTGQSSDSLSSAFL